MYFWSYSPPFFPLAPPRLRLTPTSPPSPNIMSFLCFCFCFNSLCPICTMDSRVWEHPLVPSPSTRGHILEGNGPPYSSSHWLSIAPEVSLLHAAIVNWLELVQVLFGQPQLLWTHEPRNPVMLEDNVSLWLSQSFFLILRDGPWTLVDWCYKCSIYDWAFCWHLFPVIVRFWT